MKVAIVKMSSFGDIVQAFCVLTLIKNNFPEATIDWIVEKQMAELVKAHPLVSDVIAIDLKGWKKNPFSKEKRNQLQASLTELRSKSYDIVIDLQGNLKSGLVTFFTQANKKVGFSFSSSPEALASFFVDTRVSVPKGQNIRMDYHYLVEKGLGISAPLVEEVSLQLSEDDEKKLSSFPEGFIMVCPFSAWSSKRLSNETLIAFLKKIEGSFIFLSGSEKEKKEAEMLQEHFSESMVLYRPGFALLQHIMKKCRSIISVDSFALHLAATSGTKTFSIFTPSSKSKYAPIGIKHTAIQGKCLQKQRFEKRCPFLRSSSCGCMEALTPETLFESYQKHYQLED